MGVYKEYNCFRFRRESMEMWEKIHTEDTATTIAAAEQTENKQDKRYHH